MSLCARDALHGVDVDAVLGGDYAHARTVLLAQVGEDRSLDFGLVLGSAQHLTLVPGPSQAGTDQLWLNPSKSP